MNERIDSFYISLLYFLLAIAWATHIVVRELKDDLHAALKAKRKEKKDDL